MAEIVEKVNLTVTFEVQVAVTQEALDETVQHVKDAINNPVGYNDGFVAAGQKLADLTDTREVLRVTLGEFVGDLLLNRLRPYFPHDDDGFSVKIKNAAYLDTPERLAPPEDAVPVVIAVPSKTH